MDLSRSAFPASYKLHKGNLNISHTTCTDSHLLMYLRRVLIKQLKRLFCRPGRTLFHSTGLWWCRRYRLIRGPILMQWSTTLVPRLGSCRGRPALRYTSGAWQVCISVMPAFTHIPCHTQLTGRFRRLLRRGKVQLTDAHQQVQAWGQLRRGGRATIPVCGSMNHTRVWEHA